ncbi:unnamed protein product [Amaranthus hypochondriacus]
MDEDMVSNPIQERANNRNKPNKVNGGSSRFKGVVCQQNGHWGAQIYANHHRIWLGTFKTEELAAIAYDSAAIKLRHGNSNEAYRNFPWSNVTMYEPDFQARYSTDQVLNMIKDGSYQIKFGEYLGSITQVQNGVTCDQKKQDGLVCQELFRKELTPSDVGKLNRLVIPKRYALKYFPIQDHDLELVFYDQGMKNWKFRYCYWKSSQSFVFTRGWNKFVRVKGLEAKDIVTFYMCELKGDKSDGNENNQFWMIDVVKGGDCDGRDRHEEEEEEGDEEEGSSSSVNEGEETDSASAKGFRLFGVEIVPLHVNVSMDSVK